MGKPLDMRAENLGGYRADTRIGHIRSQYSFRVPLAIMPVKLKKANLHFGQVVVTDFQICGRGDVTMDLEIGRPDGHWML